MNPWNILLEDEGPPLPLEFLVVFFVGIYAIWKIAQWWYGQQKFVIGFSRAETKERRRRLRKEFDPGGGWMALISIVWAIVLGVISGIKNGNLPNPF